MRIFKAKLAKLRNEILFEFGTELGIDMNFAKNPALNWKFMTYWTFPKSSKNFLADFKLWLMRLILYIADSEDNLVIYKYIICQLLINMYDNIATGLGNWKLFI